APGEWEADVGVERELEVVGRDEHRADDDEREQPPAPRARCADADRTRAGERYDGDHDEDGRRDPRAQRAALELVQRVSGYAEREEEREERPGQPVQVEVGCECRADGDIGEVPERVRRVQQRHVVPPAAALERVERGPYFLRPHVTSPPPTLSRFASTW